MSTILLLVILLVILAALSVALFFVSRRVDKICRVCLDPLNPGIRLGVKDLDKTPFVSSEYVEDSLGWDGKIHRMRRAKYRCSACSREFYGKTGYLP